MYCYVGILCSGCLGVGVRPLVCSGKRLIRCCALNREQPMADLPGRVALEGRCLFDIGGLLEALRYYTVFSFFDVHSNVKLNSVWTEASADCSISQ